MAILCRLLASSMAAAAAISAAPPTKFAAISLLPPIANADSELRIALGRPHKHPSNPLFIQDQPWETRIDNGYPNVVPPKKGGKEGGTAAYQLWYGNQATNGTRNRYSLLYANSSDGLHWEKPELGLKKKKKTL